MELSGVDVLDDIDEIVRDLAAAPLLTADTDTSWTVEDVRETDLPFHSRYMIKAMAAPCLRTS
jgi:DNA polymerase elongation subunit (family B)